MAVNQKEVKSITITEKLDKSSNKCTSSNKDHNEMSPQTFKTSLQPDSLNKLSKILSSITVDLNDPIQVTSLPFRIIKTLLLIPENRARIKVDDCICSLEILCNDKITNYNRIAIFALTIAVKHQTMLTNESIVHLKRIINDSNLYDVHHRREVLSKIIGLNFSLYQDIIVEVNERYYLTVDELDVVLTQAMIKNRLDIFTDILERFKDDIDIDMRSQLINRAFYANKSSYCTKLIAGLCESELCIIRSQVPDLDILHKPSEIDMANISKDIEHASSSFDLQTAYTIHKSLGSIDFDSDLAIDLFTASLKFDDLQFSRLIFESHTKIINPRLTDMYIVFSREQDAVRLTNLLRLNIECLRLTYILDLKNGSSLTDLQIESINRISIDYAIDRNQIDQNWLLKMYRFYYLAIDLQCAWKITILANYINVNMENGILKIENTINHEISFEIRNSLILYNIMSNLNHDSAKNSDSNEMIENFMIYFLNTRKVNVMIYDQILLRTAIQLGFVSIVNLLSE